MSTAKSIVSLTLGYAKTGSITDVLENLATYAGRRTSPAGRCRRPSGIPRGAQTTKRAQPRGMSALFVRATGVGTTGRSGSGRGRRQFDACAEATTVLRQGLSTTIASSE